MFTMAFKVTVNREKCGGCEECIEVCTAEVLQMEGGKSVPLREDKCVGCGSCAAACKEAAIAVEELQPTLSVTCQSLLRDIL